MARGVPHSDETRAAVMAALLAGQSVNAVAQQFHIGKATVSAWNASLGSGGTNEVRTQKGDELGELVSGYLRENLTTLKAQSTFFRDEAWLREQPAADLAVLHGVIADKTLRLLSALQAGEDTDSA